MYNNRAHVVIQTYIVHVLLLCSKIGFDQSRDVW